MTRARWMGGVGAILISLTAATASAEAVPEVEELWSAVDAQKELGDLASLNMSLDLIEQELNRRVKMAFLRESDGYVVKNRKRVAATRKWLAPQLPHYAKLVSLSEDLEKNSWNLNLFEGTKEKFETYAGLLAKVDEADALADSFKQAYPRSVESRPVKKLGAARMNLDNEQKRAVAAWLKQAEDQFDVAASRREHVPDDVPLLLLRVRAVDPHNGAMKALITRLEAYRKQAFEARSRAKPAFVFPTKDLEQYARFKDELKAVYYRREPMNSVRRVTLPREPGVWVEADSREERQSLPAYFGIRDADGKCEVNRVWFWTGRKHGEKKFSSFEISGIERLSPIDCAKLEG